MPHGRECTLRRSTFIALFAVFVIAAAFRIWYYTNENWMLSRDSLQYIDCVIRWKNSDDFYIAKSESGTDRQYYPPLLLAFMKILSFKGKYCAQVGVMISMTAGIVFCLLLYRIGWLLFKNVPGAYLAGMFAAVNPYLIEFSVQAQREMLFLLFVAAILCLILKDDFRFPADLILGGVLTSAAFLTRYEALELLLIWGVFFFHMARKNKSPRSFFVWSAVLLTAFIGSTLLLGLIVGVPMRLYHNQFLRITSRARF